MFKINGVLLVILAYATALPQIYDLQDTFIHPTQTRSSVDIGGRIVGGQEAEEKQFPYEVGIFVTKSSSTVLCGGSLISPSFVLTAAHCFDDFVSAEVRLGAYHILEEESSQIRITSTTYAVHPDWDNNALVNDIAVLNLNQNVTLTDYIQTVTLTTDVENKYEGATGVVAGWGKTSDNEQAVAATLMYISNDILSNDECKSIDPFGSVIQPTHLCLDGAGEKSICNGDSGGPLTVDGVQVGLVSFGYTSCEDSKPQVFTRLTMFLDWIRENSDIDY